jgi:hypothetical protein
VELECDVARTDTLTNSFHPNRTVVHHNPHITSNTHYTSQVKFFADGTFFKEISGNPLSLKTGTVRSLYYHHNRQLLNQTLESHLNKNDFIYLS